MPGLKKLSDPAFSLIHIPPLAEAKRFFEENGHLNVPAGYRSSSSKDLDAWIDRQRSAKVKAKLSDSQKKQLEAIGFQW